MRSMTTINWVRETLTTASGYPLGTIHLGDRGSWTFQIRTSTGGRPRLMARCSDGRAVQQDHVSLKAAKNAALELLHPSERMGWSAVSTSDPVLYRAHWDDLVFVVFETPQENLMFQWRNKTTGYKAPAAPVSGIREAREMAAAVLRDSYPPEVPPEASKAANRAHEVVAEAMQAAGIDFTPEQLDATVSWFANWRPLDDMFGRV